MRIGIDLGGTGIKAGLVTEDGVIIRKDSVPTGPDRHYSEIVKDTADLCFRLINEEGLTADDIVSVGIGIPGLCDAENGVLIYSNNINFKHAPIVSEMGKYIKCPISIENDANCAALGEAKAGAAKGVSNSLTITLGTGVGSGVIINGKVYGGFNCAGSEAGHMVIESNGVPCNCGRRGCFEVYSSAPALARMTVEAAEQDKQSKIWELCEGSTEKIGGRTAYQAAGKGDKTGQAVVDKYIHYLSEGVANMINLFQPELLCIGGGVSNEGDNLLIPLQKAVGKKIYGQGIDGITNTKIVLAQLGNDAGIIGAAFL